MYGGTAPEWARIESDNRLELTDALHDARSAALHIHIYAVEGVRPEGYQPLPSSGPSHPPLTAPSQNCAPSSLETSRSQPLSADACSPSKDQSCDVRQERASGHVLHDSAGSSPASSRDSPEDSNLTPSCQPSLLGHKQEGKRSNGRIGTAASLSKQEPDVRWPATDTTHAAAAGTCQAVPLPGTLILAASFDLNTLEPLGSLSELDDRISPPNTLIVELEDGLYVWPPSAHLVRTASEALPSAAAAVDAPAASSTVASSGWASPQVRRPYLYNSDKTAAVHGPSIKHLINTGAQVPKQRGIATGTPQMGLRRDSILPDQAQPALSDRSRYLHPLQSRISCTLFAAVLGMYGHDELGSRRMLRHATGQPQSMNFWRMTQQGSSPTMN